MKEKPKRQGGKNRFYKAIVCALLLFITGTLQLKATTGVADAGIAEQAQQNRITVTGVVADSNGDPLIGVSVVEKGTTNGTMTNSEGRYSIRVSGQNAVLKVTYLGYEPRELTVGSQTTIDIQMSEDSQTLDEVIVTAYGTTKKASFTGSASVIGADALDKIQPANLTQGLQGLSPGLQVINNSGAPGTDATIMIRGLGSMKASSEPLYIVDGIPYAGDLNTLSPSDIENITVLKDASSTALYGSRAANGVIMITTKKGKAGKTRVNVRANWGTSDFAVKFPEKSDPARQYELTFEGLYNDGTDKFGMSDSEAREYAYNRVSRIYWFESNTVLDDRTVRKYLSDWNTDYPVGLDGKIKSDAKRLYNYDVYDESFGNRLKQDYSIDISGGMGENNTYYISFSTLDDKGIYVGEEYKRSNIRMQLTSQITDWLTWDNSVAYITSTNYNTSTPINAFRNFPTVYSAFIWDHNTNNYAVSPYTGGRILDVGEQSRAWWTGWSAFGYLVESTRDKTDNVFARTSANFKILPSLSFRTSYGYDLSQSFNSWNRSPERGTNLKPGDGLVDRDGNRNVTQTFNNVLTFDKVFAKDHHVNALLGVETYQWRNDVWESGRRGLALVGMTEQSSASGAATAYSWNDNYRLLSFLSRAEYDFKSKYYVSGSYRRDGSSRFNEDNRWGNFWSLGGSWRVSQESFMEGTRDWLSNLKLKLSYGEVGNDNVGLYAYQGLYTTQNYFGQGGVILDKLATPDVKWETNTQLNGGIEFTLFGKLDATFEVYKRKSKDLLMDKPLAYSIGKTSYLANIGDLQNVGWEVDLRYHAIKTKNFDWMVGFNASAFTNEITSLPSEEEIFTVGSATYKWKIGGSRYDIYAPDWAGVDPQTGRNNWYKYSFDENGNVTGKEITDNYGDVMSTDQYIKVGSSLPKVYGSLTNSFRYRDFDFSFMLYYSYGSKYYDSQYVSNSGAYGSNASTEFTEKRWQKPGDITTVPKIYSEYSGTYYTGAYSTQYVFDNDFIRLRNVTLGYNLPKKLMKKWGIEGIRLFVVGENLLTFGTSVDYGTDPENVGMEGIVQDDAGLPIRKTYSGGIVFQF